MLHRTVAAAVFVAASLIVAACANAEAAPAAPDLAAEAKAQFDRLQKDIAGRAWFEKIAPQAYRSEALIFSSDRDPLDVVLRRTAVLLADLRRRPGCPDLASADTDLADLKARADRTAVADAAARYDLYAAACALRRRIAFANPLLDFDRILMVRRPRSGGVNHMCDQYYGCNARPTDGGLYVLQGPFGPRPAMANALENARVESGRLAGRTLARGGFLSPDLSFDARTTAFAYTELGEGDRWSPGKSFHIFKVNADGTGLVQLTDGPWNDFDPCWMPNGRIVFISERRGGMCRCGGRPVPTYTLHAMNPDGTNVACLSYHETNEWHPSVDASGLIVYSRWDYVDRDTNAAHHPWLCTPDGCNARSVHGNYAVTRNGRPWMELNVRAIPGSPRYVATAAPHHGQAYGSLVVLDPALVDDGAMSQLRRLTPEEPFPEAERKGEGPYATAWPLGEEYYLAAHAGAVCLLDAFGNREVLWSAGGPWLDPIPLRPRPAPPVVPDRSTLFASAAPAGPAQAGAAPPQTGPAAPVNTIAVMNVYESRRPWPPGTVIRALRIIQLLPKTTPNADVPKIGVAKQASARAVLGTVPVEADGSAYFTAPVNKAIYFQALDARGMAVQSMRSVAYLHEGERMTCIGCHEPPGRTQAVGQGMPLALRRAPSGIRPDPDGSNPFNYIRLVQPVLDRHCVACHEKEPKAPDLRGTMAKKGFSLSYGALAANYGFYFHSFNGSYSDRAHGGLITIPGQFGARAAKLMQVIEGPAHRERGLKLSDEDRYRITVWLDSNSDFYGAYENIEAQARGEIVRPALE